MTELWFGTQNSGRINGKGMRRGSTIYQQLTNVTFYTHLKHDDSLSDPNHKITGGSEKRNCCMILTGRRHMATAGL